MDRPVRDEMLECHVLHRWDHGNSSLLLEVFTRRRGRFPLLAKGAKRARGGDAALLQPFRPLLIAVSGSGEVKTLVRVEPAAAPPVLAGKVLYCGFYLNELILRMLDRSDPHEGLYDYYQAALDGLAANADPAPWLRRFELRLLQETGYAMVLDRDVERNGPLRPEGRYRYEQDWGPVECPSGGSGFTVSGATLLAMAAGAPLPGESAREAKELMRRVLDGHLGGRPLKSRELFRKLYPKDQ